MGSSSSNSGGMVNEGHVFDLPVKKEHPMPPLPPQETPTSNYQGIVKGIVKGME